MNSALKAVFAPIQVPFRQGQVKLTENMMHCNIKAKHLNTRYQEPLARKAPAGSAHSPTKHKHDVSQLMACSLKQATIQPFVCFQKIILTTMSAARAAPPGTRLTCINKQHSVLLFSTTQLFAGMILYLQMPEDS